MAGGRKKSKPTRSNRHRLPEQVARLYPYQKRWVDDSARWKIACKARQIGFTFAATLRAVWKRLDEPGLTVWLSASERQALEAMEQVRRHLQGLGVTAEFSAEAVAGTSAMQQRVSLPNGSRLVALPANPDTVRGFAGDIILDEFAFHRDSHAIWRAAFATATRGFQIEVISTPNGAQGKFYELARQAGLVDRPAPLALSGVEGSGVPRLSLGTVPRLSLGTVSVSRTVSDSRTVEGQAGLVGTDETRKAKAETRPDDLRISNFPPAADAPRAHEFRSPTQSVWSAHWCDVYTARALGFDVDLNSLRAAVDDDDTWQQEYCCRFLSEAAPYLPLELVVAAEFSDPWPVPLDLPFSESRLHGTARGTLSGSRRVTRDPELVPRSRRAGLGTVPRLSLGTVSVSRTVSDSRTAERVVGHGSPNAAATPLLEAGSWRLEARQTEPPGSRLGEHDSRFMNHQPKADPPRADESRCYLGVDIGRHRDRTVLWLLEERDATLWTRMVHRLEAAPFAEQRATIAALLEQRGERPDPSFDFRISSFARSFAVQRCAIDSTGLGAMLAEELHARFGARVEPVVFTLAVKEDLAVRLKRYLEDRRLRIPYDPQLRRALGAVKRYTTSTGHFRFDAARTEEGHADEFWALALACYAAESLPISTEFISRGTLNVFSQANIF